jgi:hypothetical protein
MADNDRNRGYRDNETYRRPRPQSPDPSGDPLAELARLIGQQNESTSSYRQGGGSPLGGQPAAGQGWAPEPYPQSNGGGQGASHWPSSQSQQAAPYGSDQYDPRYGSGAPQSDHGYAGDYAAPYVDPQQAGAQYADGHYADQHYDDQRYSDQPSYGTDQRYDDSGYVDPRNVDPRYAEPRYADQRHPGSQQDASGYEDGAAQAYTDPRYSDPRYADPRYADPNFGTQAQAAPSYASESDGYAQPAMSHGYAAYGYQDGSQGQEQAYENSYYGAPPLPGAMARAADERVPARRRGSIVTVLAVLALAVVGTAAAFGYRAVFVGTGTAVPPPVIKADTQPSKVVPAADANSKPIQDRIGVRTEKIVPRQEEPVQQAAPGQPRVIAPFLAGQNPQAFPPASANIAPGNGSAAQLAEPKRVRTVPIKPQQQGAEAPGPRSSRNASPAETEENVADSSHAPMALSPTGSVPSTQRPAARQAHAALTPNEAAGGSPFPTPLPASTGPGPSRAPVAGPFAVQVTSQRSESDAQASFKSLQQQFPSVLGNRQPVIRRADLGERGTYYRAQIPFQSQGEANEFCSSLKAAGGQCVIARN